MTGEPRSTPAQRAQVRHRYLSPPSVVMPCLQCGQWMALDPPERYGADIIWTWRCPQSPEHRPVRHIDHYGDLDVIAVLDDADTLAGASAELGRYRRALEAAAGRAEAGLDSDFGPEDNGFRAALGDIVDLARAALADATPPPAQDRALAGQDDAAASAVALDEGAAASGCPGGILGERSGA